MVPPGVWGFDPYALALIAAIAVGAGLAFDAARRAGVPVRRMATVIAVALVSALIGSKVHSLLQRGTEAAPWTWELLHGYRFPGGIAGAVAGVLLCGRFATSPWTAGDLLAPSFGISLAIVRLGCFSAGCCFGAVCDLSWCAHFPQASPAWRLHVMTGLLPPTAAHSLGVHPLQLYLAAAALGCGLFALWYRPRARFAGDTLLAYLSLQAASTFFLEALRAPIVPSVRWGSFVIALCAGAWWFRRRVGASSSPGAAAARAA